MAEISIRRAGWWPWVIDKFFMGLSPREYVRSLVTPGNIENLAALAVAGIR